MIKTAASAASLRGGRAGGRLDHVYFFGRASSRLVHSLDPNIKNGDTQQSPQGNADAEPPADLLTALGQLVIVSKSAASAGGRPKPISLGPRLPAPIVYNALSSSC